MLTPLLTFCLHAHRFCLRAYLFLRGAYAGLRAPQFCLRHTLTRGPLLNMNTRDSSNANLRVPECPAGMSCWTLHEYMLIFFPTSLTPRTNRDCSKLSVVKASLRVHKIGKGNGRGIIDKFEALRKWPWGNATFWVFFLNLKTTQKASNMLTQHSNTTVYTPKMYSDWLSDNSFNIKSKILNSTFPSGHLVTTPSLCMKEPRPLNLLGRGPRQTELLSKSPRGRGMHPRV